MLIFFQEILLQLFLWLLKLIDGIMEIFGAISGISTVTYQGQQINILDLLIGDSTVGTVFWCIFILAIGLCCIFAIVGLIKNMIVGNKTVSSIMGKFFLALLGTLAVLTVVILGILISNALLKLVSEVFQLGGTTKLSSALFNACVADWKKSYTVAEFNVDLSVEKIFGDYTTTLGIWPKSWKGNGMVDPNTFMYLPALIASAGLIIALIIACVNLAKRIYEIILLYLVMPVSMSALPLDDGARFKVWRESFVTKIILAYGTVFSVNLFILILPLINQMKITGAGKFTNAIFLIIMLVGGAVVIPAGQTMFARLFGAADEANAGGGFLRSAFYGARIAGAAAFGAGVTIVKGGASAVKKIMGDGSSGGGKKDEEGSEKFSEESSTRGSSTQESISKEAESATPGAASGASGEGSSSNSSGSGSGGGV